MPSSEVLWFLSTWTSPVSELISNPSCFGISRRGSAPASTNSPSMDNWLYGVVEEAPEAYKNVDSVVDVSHKLGIATKVARLVPIGVIKG